MRSSTRVTTKPLSAGQQLTARIAACDPKLRPLIRSVRSALRKRFPSANELVYDYGRSLVIAYAPGERGSDAFVAISAGAEGLRLIFNQGPTLPDPKNILLGSGRQTRFIWIESAKTLDRPEVRSLLKSTTLAAKNAKARIDVARRPSRQSGGGVLIIK